MHSDQQHALASLGPLGADNRRRQQGRSFELGGGADDKSTVRLVFTGAANKSEDAIGDSLASVLTVTTSIDDLATPADARPLVRGVVEWGSDGHQTRAVFDWLRGTVIHVCGSMCSIDAFLVPGTFNENTRVKVGAFIGYYTTRGNPATLTDRLAIAAAPGAGTALAVPDYARRVHVAPDVIAATYTVAFVDSLGAVLSIYAQGAFAAGASVPVPNGAERVVVTSTAGAFNALVVWELSI